MARPPRDAAAAPAAGGDDGAGAQRGVRPRAVPPTHTRSSSRRCPHVRGDRAAARYAPDWAAETLLPMVVRRAGEAKGYQMRAVLLDGLAEVALLVPPATLEAELLPLALAMARDKVPNLRRCSRRPAGTAPHLSTEALVGVAIPALEALERDDDMDALRGPRRA